VFDFNTSHVDGGDVSQYLSISTQENEMRYDSLTLERLKEVLAYDAATGIFTWKIRPAKNSRVHIGDEAGSQKPSGYRYINIDGRTYLAGQLAWLYMTGNFARGRIGVKDKDPKNMRFDNLFAFKGIPGHELETVEGRSKWRHAMKEEFPLHHREHGWKRYYGIDAETYQRMFAEQGGKCAICKKPERAKTPKGETKWLSVDHDHATDAVRSLLCSSCNHTLGHVGDDPELLEAAAAYLRHHKEKVN
jgi:hypothetical protein